MFLDKGEEFYTVLPAREAETGKGEASLYSGRERQYSGKLGRCPLCG